MGPSSIAKIFLPWTELNTVCPSRAGDCEGRSPVTAHPELMVPRRLYCPEQEAALFDLRAVDAYLAQFTWIRTVSAQGQLALGSQHYGLGRAWAGQKVAVQFDAPQRTFVFTVLPSRLTAGAETWPAITRPAPGLSATDLCGTIQAVPDPPRQLSFPRWLFDPFTESSPA